MKLDSIIENQKEIMGLLRQQNVSRGVSATGLVFDDVLSKPLHTKEEMGKFCRRLDDESFKANMVNIYIN